MKTYNHNFLKLICSLFLLAIVVFVLFYFINPFFKLMDGANYPQSFILDTCFINKSSNQGIQVNSVDSLTMFTFQDVDSGLEITKGDSLLYTYSSGKIKVSDGTVYYLIKPDALIEQNNKQVFIKTNI